MLRRVWAQSIVPDHRITINSSISTPVPGTSGAVGSSYAVLARKYRLAEDWMYESYPFLFG